MAAQFAGHTSDLRRIRHPIFLQHVFPPHIAGGEDGDKGSRRSGLLHAGAPASFLTLDQAHHSHDGESKFAGCFNRLNGGSSCGADIIHNHHWRTLLTKALNALPGTMLLLGFATKPSQVKY